MKINNEKKEKFIIVGNGAAGTNACVEIRKRNLSAQVELISTENCIGYNRPMLTKGILSRIDNPNFNIKPKNWYDENGITVTLGLTVTGIDAKRKSLILSNGDVRFFDKLILATGAISNVPPIDGVDLAGVFSIRTLSDIGSINSYLSNVKKAVVVGGGLLGLETAWEICQAGKEVTVVQNSEFLMNRQLDTKGSEILGKIVEKAGIIIKKKSGCQKLIGENGRVKGVILKDGSIIEADMVIFSTGIKANIALARESGIETDRFIFVNEKMETNMADVYACGDCAIFDGKSFGLWSQAIDMGKVAGANAAGDDLSYKTIVPSTFFNGMGTMLYSIGDPGKNPDREYTTHEVFDDEKNVYEKLYFSGGKFVGGVLIGDVKKSTRLLKAFKNEETTVDLIP